MKRDIDLIRALLTALEEKDNDDMVSTISVDGFTELEVKYHLVLMDQAGLIRCERIVSSSTSDRIIDVLPFGLSWKGHEFLESARNEEIWNKAKSVSKARLGSISFEILSTLLIELSKKAVGL